MVASGLVNDPRVSHVRLAVHLLTALVIFAALIWVALDLRGLAADPAARAPKMSILASWTLSALFVQMLFGAYVAGLDAGHAFSSWPKMGEEWFPADTQMLRPFLVNFVDNPIVVQFVHRWFAFVAAAFAAALAWQAIRRRIVAPGVAVLTAVTAQILLGILTLLTGVELWIAVAHQGMAALLLASIVWTAHRVGERRIEAAPASAASVPGATLAAEPA
jgi:cytochrome c oxidase assembly protein subunit 15